MVEAYKCLELTQCYPGKESSESENPPRRKKEMPPIAYDAMIANVRGDPQLPTHDALEYREY